jgi:DNA-binding transcriptional ArsR family regulator
VDMRTVEVLKALGNPTRLQIMEWLRTPEASFSEYEPIADRASGPFMLIE